MEPRRVRVGERRPRLGGHGRSLVMDSVVKCWNRGQRAVCSRSHARSLRVELRRGRARSSQDGSCIISLGSSAPAGDIGHQCVGVGRRADGRVWGGAPLWRQGGRATGRPAVSAAVRRGRRTGSHMPGASAAVRRGHTYVHRQQCAGFQTYHAHRQQCAGVKHIRCIGSSAPGFTHIMCIGSSAPGHIMCIGSSAPGSTGVDI